MSQTITLKLIKYYYTGVVNIEDWNGSIGTINTNPSYSEILYNQNEITNIINDGGYGCRRIISAIITIWELYGIRKNQPINKLYPIKKAVLKFNTEQCNTIKNLGV